jgi:response regulator RpfG family c-di-GMP phosphodiesterase
VRGYLVVGDNRETREALGVLLRSQGLAVTLVPMPADAIRFLRSNPVETAIIVAGNSDVSAMKLRSRILEEKWASRVLLVNPVVSGHGQQRVLRLGIGDYRLSEKELLALLAAEGEPRASEGGDSPADRPIDALVQVVDVLVGLEELGDTYFRGSSHRSVHLARSVGERMGLPKEGVLEIVIATLLKDIGNAGIRRGLREDGGVYSQAQRVRMQEHVTASVRLLEHIDFPWKILPIIRHHHENYDGTGYPDGLKGPEIPVGARILCAVDAYVAMLSDRPHRSCLPRTEAQEEMVRGTGTQFDPEVVEVLLQAIPGGGVSLSSNEKPVVLIADSDAQFVDLLTFRLVNEGIEVRAVASPEEAILEILERPPHLVLSSAGSDPERVLQLLLQVREDRDRRLVPFAFMTESDDRVFRVRAFRRGADDVLLKTGDLEEIVARVEAMLAREAARRSADEGPPQRGITGRIENLSLPDIFQILNLGLKTARVTLTAEGGATGTIWFDSGAAVHAQAEGATGERACYEMLRWKQGQFCIEHGLHTDETSIEMDTMLVVMEGLRLLDEASATPSEVAAG